jgi:hypothetical protein
VRIDPTIRHAPRSALTQRFLSTSVQDRPIVTQMAFPTPPRATPGDGPGRAPAGVTVRGAVPLTGSETCSVR